MIVKLFKTNVVKSKVSCEPSTARLLTELTVANSYVMTLPHGEDSFRAFALVLRNDVSTEFTINFRNDVLVLSDRLHIS